MDVLDLVGRLLLLWNGSQRMTWNEALDPYHAGAPALRHQSFRLPPDLHRELETIADRRAASVSKILELLLQGFRDNAWKVELAPIEQRRTELEAAIAASEVEPVMPAIHPNMATVYRQKVEQLAAALAHEDEELREAARSGPRGFIDEIVIPPGDALLVVRGDLGRMLATAAGERDGSMLAAVVESGCGGGICR